MPIYEYECRTCGHKLEKLQKMSDQPLADCPACAQAGLRKLVSPVAFRLKGGGWYETDFKDEKTRRNVTQEDDKAGKPDGENKVDDGGKEKGNKTDGQETKAKSATTDSTTTSAD